jgi:EAL domain-containing protein (putative c-di-GMP-specific phosphodiesterase class I)
MMNELTRWLRPTDDKRATSPAKPEPAVEGRPPVCFIIDPDEPHRRFMSLVLEGHGIETGMFAGTAGLRDGLADRRPDLVFLDVPTIPTDAMEALRILVDGDYHGPLQFVSRRGDLGLDRIKQFGEHNALQMLTAVTKPLDRAVITRIVHEQNLDTPTTQSEKIGLDVALRENWIEFWYQPKIDLRRKQLAGVELFARVQHPVHGAMPPGAFMEDADEKSLMALTEKSIIDALETGVKFSKQRINLKLAVNVSLNALVKLPLPAIVREHRPDIENWPGLILDITEDEIASDLSLVREVHAQLESSGIRLAIDDFGRGYVPLTRLRQLPPFAELKVDRTFVADCANDKGHASICKSVIDLAHNFGALAVGVGVENPADALALTQMGCDLGQGYLFAQPMPEDRFHTLMRQRAERSAAAAPARTAASGK